MKRRATKSTKNLHIEESRFSRKLFNKSDKLAEKFKSNKYNKNKVHEDVDEKPVWVDEDDVNFGANIIPNVKSKGLYVDKLKQKYETLMGTPNWAKLKKAETGEHSRDHTLLPKVGHFSKKKYDGLPIDYLDWKKIYRINFKTANEGPYINCIEFHPKSTVALVGGQAGIVSLFSVGSKINDKLHSFRLKNWNVQSAHFNPNGNVAYLSGSNTRNICIYDLIKAEPQLVQLPKNIQEAQQFKMSPDGKYLAITDGFDEAFIMCAESRELLRVLKHNSTVASITFSHDSKQLYSFGAQGEVTIWDLSTYRSVKKFNDHGCVMASKIASSPCGRLLATGSKEGIVNIYQTSDLDSTYPLPIKTVSNLTTKIFGLKFNPTTEILAIHTQRFENGIKLVHIPSYRVFLNFPIQNNSLGYVTVTSFSPNGGFMGLGNSSHFAHLYRLKYFSNY